MLNIILVLCAIATVVWSGRISYSSCKGGGPLPKWAAVEGCDESSCTVINGHEITLSAEIDVNVRATQLATRLLASVGILNFELTLPGDVVDGCNAFARGCPLTYGSVERINTTFVVAAALSNIKPTIEFSLSNEVGERVMCVRTRITLVRG